MAGPQRLLRPFYVIETLVVQHDGLDGRVPASSEIQQGKTRQFLVSGDETLIKILYPIPANIILHLCL